MNTRSKAPKKIAKKAAAQKAPVAKKSPAKKLPVTKKVPAKKSPAAKKSASSAAGNRAAALEATGLAEQLLRGRNIDADVALLETKGKPFYALVRVKVEDLPALLG